MMLARYRASSSICRAYSARCISSKSRFIFRLVDERKSKLVAIKEENETKIELLAKHVSELEQLRADIVENFNSIVTTMEEELFSKILINYGQSLDYIQKTYVQ